MNPHGNFRYENDDEKKRCKAGILNRQCVQNFLSFKASRVAVADAAPYFCRKNILRI